MISQQYDLHESEQKAQEGGGMPEGEYTNRTRRRSQPIRTDRGEGRPGQIDGQTKKRRKILQEAKENRDESRQNLMKKLKPNGLRDQQDSWMQQERLTMPQHATSFLVLVLLVHPHHHASKEGTCHQLHYDHPSPSSCNKAIQKQIHFLTAAQLQRISRIFAGR